MTRLTRRLVAAVCLLLAAAAWPAPAAAEQVELYFFWSESCPHCREAKPVIDGLAGARPWLSLHALEVGGNPDNARLYERLARLAGDEARYVPAFLFCGEMQVGWDTRMPAVLAERLDACHRGSAAAPPPPAALDLPLLGRIAPEQASLPLLTVLLGGLDAFNPCAFFVLLFLLSLMVHARSRARMLLVGGLFVVISGLVYFLFMAAWLNLFLLTAELRAVTLAAGLAALLMGGLNIKDYVLWGRGPSLAIPDAAKPRLFDRMRRLVAARSLPAMLAGTAVLAVAANSYELLCTAGFPMVFTRILTLRALTPAEHLLYLALYNIVYVLPLLAIVAGFVLTLGSRKLSETQGRVLKLLSGLMMTGLGGVLTVAPGGLDSPLVALGVPAAALVLTAAVTILRPPGRRA